MPSSLTGLSSLWTNYANYGSDKYVKAVGFNKINADETMEGAIACQSVAGVKAIVYSYEDSNGEKIVNPAAEEWANSVLQ